MDTIRIATRKSPLALKQTNIVAEQLTALHSQIKIEIVPIVSEGDKQLAGSLSEIGGKGLFVKSLEKALAREPSRHCGSFYERCAVRVIRNF